MKHWMDYVKASYELIMLGESRCNVVLQHEVEAWTVHAFARYMEQPHILDEAIALKMMTALNESGTTRKTHLQSIAEECAIVYGLGLNRRRWPTQHYYCDMGRLACEHRAWCDRPPELFYERVAQQFEQIGTVISHIRG